MSSVTICLADVPDEKKGVLLALLAVIMGYNFEEDEEKSPEPDPSLTFGTPIPSGPLSPAAPVVNVPNLPAVPVLIAPQIVPPQPAQTTFIVDSSGLPWDSRIHASSHTQNADKTWRLRRGVDDATLTNVTAELRRLMAVPLAGPQLVPAPPSTVPPPPAPPSNEVELREKFVALVNRASAALGSGIITQEQVKTCLSGIGLETMPQLGLRLDLIPAACSLIDGIIAGQKA